MTPVEKGRWGFAAVIFIEVILALCGINTETHGPAVWLDGWTKYATGVVAIAVATKGLVAGFRSLL
jgi:hypothetical protein